MVQAAEKLSKFPCTPIKVLHLGLRPFREVWELQREIQQKLIEGGGEEHLILCQHLPVITMGRSSDPKNILCTQKELARRGIELFAIERGGDVTFHGPGQLVAYPLLDLRTRKQDVGWYMRALEEAIINTLKRYNIESFRVAGKTGVWTYSRSKDINTTHSDGRAERAVAKIASIGVRMSRWCTLHGIALNVEDCSEGFGLINPCGFSELEVSSMSQFGTADLAGTSMVLERQLLDCLS